MSNGKDGGSKSALMDEWVGNAMVDFELKGSEALSQSLDEMRLKSELASERAKRFLRIMRGRELGLNVGFAILMLLNGRRRRAHL